jgi:hypothetical protein
MGAIHATPPAKPQPKEERDGMAELLGRLPVGTSLAPALIMQGAEQEPRRRWQIKHDKLNFFVVRDTPEEAVRAFLFAVDKRGLRPVLEGINTMPPTPPPPPPPMREPTLVPRPAVV